MIQLGVAILMLSPKAAKGISLLWGITYQVADWEVAWPIHHSHIRSFSKVDWDLQKFLMAKVCKLAGSGRLHPAKDKQPAALYKAVQDSQMQRFHCLNPTFHKIKPYSDRNSIHQYYISIY